MTTVTVSLDEKWEKNCIPQKWMLISVAYIYLC